MTTSVIPPEIPIAAVELLTERQREVLALVGTGMRNDEIAAYLCRGGQTVARHCVEILDRVEMSVAPQDRFLVRRREALVSLAVRAGLALPSDPRGFGHLAASA